MSYGLAYHHANGVVSYGRVVMASRQEAEEEAMYMQLVINKDCVSAQSPNAIIKVEPTKLEL